MKTAARPRERHLTVVPDPQPPKERTLEEVLIDLALFGTRLWLRPFGYRVRIERREPVLPTWWRGE